MSEDGRNKDEIKVAKEKEVRGLIAQIILAVALKNNSGAVYLLAQAIGLINDFKLSASLQAEISSAYGVMNVNARDERDEKIIPSKRLEELLAEYEALEKELTENRVKLAKHFENADKLSAAMAGTNYDEMLTHYEEAKKNINAHAQDYAKQQELLEKQKGAIHEILGNHKDELTNNDLKKYVDKLAEVDKEIKDNKQKMQNHAKNVVVAEAVKQIIGNKKNVDANKLIKEVHNHLDLHKIVADHVDKITTSKDSHVVFEQNITKSATMLHTSYVDTVKTKEYRADMVVGAHEAKLLAKLKQEATVVRSI
ncbi:MAG: hypothetical protein ACHP6I_02320 [Rickettsiales bacterium]